MVCHATGQAGGLQHVLGAHFRVDLTVNFVFAQLLRLLLAQHVWVDRMGLDLVLDAREW